MARHNSPSAFSTQRIAAPYAGRGNRNKTVASVAPCKKQMAVINWENVLAPLDWMAVYLGLGRDNSAVEAAVVRCRSSPDLLQSLAAIEERTMQLLTETMRLVDGPVFIVSEYSTSYVELVSSLFFPRLTAALRSASTGIYVVGTPNTQLTALEMKQWKVNLLHTAILEYLFAGIDEVAATNLLARSAFHWECNGWAVPTGIRRVGVSDERYGAGGRVRGDGWATLQTTHELLGHARGVDSTARLEVPRRGSLRKQFVGELRAAGSELTFGLDTQREELRVGRGDARGATSNASESDDETNEWGDESVTGLRRQRRSRRRVGFGRRRA
ncbi:hypothetical protein PR001_g18652 [Phytophthora rubi]|uniref:Uncharacterized protein n=1 Tax=Phytophthora rubi TaxID=129364 RepID=A0A6A3K3Y3_9STRA|nr:hypothetical protein PR001_g18652 [Phytophthora rubi]